MEVDVIIAEAFAGGALKLELELKIPCESFLEALKITFTASVFFEWRALLWSDRYDWVFAKAQLYPPNKGITLSVSGSELKFMPPLPQDLWIKGANASSVFANVPGVFKENMQIYCKPQIVSLGNGQMFMAYIDDNSDRTDENRTILMYTVYDGITWSTPLPVFDDGTVDFEPELRSDGQGGVHILWQDGITTFDPGVTLEEMSAGVDLHYIHWNGTSFDGYTAITDNNENLETNYKIASSGNNISVMWLQNSNNDPFALSGMNSIFRRQFTDGIWQNIETLASGLLTINSMDTTYNGANNVVAYTASISNNLSVLNDMELFYFDGTQTVKVTNNDIPDYSVNFLGNELFLISGDAIISSSIDDLTSWKPAVDNLNANVTGIKAIQSPNGHKSIIWEQGSDMETTFFAVNYDESAGSFKTPEPLTENSGGVIRGWDACMLPNGQIEMAYCFAQAINEPVNGKPYGRLDLIQKASKSFYDITVAPITAYEGYIGPEQEITVFVNVYNSGSLPINQFDVKIYNDTGVLLQGMTIEGELSVGEGAEIEIPFTLPSILTLSDYRIEVLPGNGVDLSPSNNEAFFTVGYADLIICDIQKFHACFIY